jgi:hypothetical protein
VTVVPPPPPSGVPRQRANRQHVVTQRIHHIIHTSARASNLSLLKLTMASKYLCAFLQPDDHPPPLLGNASRIGMRTSKKEADAARFLYYLLFYSPNPWKLEQKYLEELRKSSDSASQISRACWLISADALIQFEFVYS